MSLSRSCRHRQEERDAQEIGGELGVNAVIVGRVTQFDEHASVSLELVDVRDGSHLWGARYNRNMQDILSAQEEIAAEAFLKLKAALCGDESQCATNS